MTGTTRNRDAVFALDVDGQPEVDRSGVDPVGLLLDGREVVAHRALLAGGMNDRPADEVGEAHLARRDLPVELLAPLLERRHLDLAEARGRGDVEARGHVLGQPRGRALDGRCPGRERGRRRLLGRPNGNGGRWLAIGLAGRRRRLDGLEAAGPGVKEAPPLGIHARRIAAVQVVQVQHVAGVDQVQLIQGRGHVAARIRWRDVTGVRRAEGTRERRSLRRSRALVGRPVRVRARSPRWRSPPPAAPTPAAGGARH